MNLAFDLDCVVDTYAAQLAAYRAVDVEPPAGFHARPWASWCSARDHDRMEAALLDALPAGTLLPAARMLAACGGTVLCAAGHGTVEAVLAMRPELRSNDSIDWCHDLTMRARIDWLSGRGVGVYFDGREDAVELVWRRTRWQVVCTKDLEFEPGACPEWRDGDSRNLR